jgi:hypothetical protein
MSICSDNMVNSIMSWENSWSNSSFRWNANCLKSFKKNFKNLIKKTGYHMLALMLDPIYLKACASLTIMWLWKWRPFKILLKCKLLKCSLDHRNKCKHFENSCVKRATCIPSISYISQQLQACFHLVHKFHIVGLFSQVYSWHPN